MFTRILLIVSLFFAFSTAATANDCFGPRERDIAKLLLKQHAVRDALDREWKEARYVHNETCDSIAMVGKGKPFDIDYSETLFEDKEFEYIAKVSLKHHLRPVQVVAALYHLHQWSHKDLPTPEEMRKHPPQ